MSPLAKRLRRRRAYLAALGICTTLPLHAQETSAPKGLEEVVVTARKREESLQEVPITITAITAEELRAKSIADPYDLKFHSPGLEMRGGRGFRESPQFFIRGLGGEQGVVVYFADVPLSLGRSITNIPFFDLSSVQALKGPQGTLFGRSSTGGAVIYTPQHPTNEFEGQLNVSAGNLNMREYTGVLNVPIIPDKLMVRAAANISRRDGYTTSIVTGQRLDDLHKDTYRLGITFKPVPWLDTYTMFQDERTNEAGTANILADFNPNLSLFNVAVATPTITAVCGGLNRGNSAAAAACVQQRQARLSALVAGLQTEFSRVATVRNGVVDFNEDAIRRNSTSRLEELTGHNQQIVNTIAVSIPTLPFLGDVTFKNIFSTTRILERSQIGELEGAPLQHGYNYNYWDLINFVPSRSAAVDKASKSDFLDTFSEEFQIQGSIDNKHTWILGYYLQQSEDDLAYPPFFGVFGNIFNTTLDTPNVNGGLTLDSLNMEKGYFGQFTADLSDWLLDGLRFTAGYRWTESYSRRKSAPAVVTATGIVPGTPIVAGPTLNDDAPSWTVSFDYQIHDGLLAYIAHRRGFIPGGVNLVPPGTENIPGVRTSFDPETVDDVELGVKYDWLLGDMPIRTNAAVYKIWWNDVQRMDNVQEAVSPFRLITQTNNIAKAEIQGLELDTLMNATERLSFSFNYSYIDAEYVEWPGFFNFQGQLIPRVNSKFIGTPKHQGTIGVRYEMPMGAQLGTFVGSADYYRQSDVLLNDVYLQEGSRTGLQKGYGNLNLRVELAGIAGTPLDVSLFGRNVTDDTHLVFVGGLFVTLGSSNSIWAQPRTWGVELRYRFGGED